MFSYSLSRPFESLNRRYITDASTFAGLEVFGSLRSEITDKRIVLDNKKRKLEKKSMTKLNKQVLGNNKSWLLVHI